MSADRAQKLADAFEAGTEAARMFTEANPLSSGISVALFAMRELLAALEYTDAEIAAAEQVTLQVDLDFS